MLTDCHCHILSNYVNKEDVFNNLEDSNIKRIIINGYDLESNMEVIDYVSYDRVYGALGLHPDNMSNQDDDVIKYIKDNLNNKKIIAIGEIGLDYFHNKDNKEEQINTFEKLLKIAEDNNLPVIVHSRDAAYDTISILKKYNVKGIIHAFSGSYEIACEYIKIGYKLGIGGILTFKNAKLRDVLEKISIDNILLETDSPYLTPEPLRSLPNEPANVNFVCRELLKIYNLSKDEIELILENNFNEFFDL